MSKTILSKKAKPSQRQYEILMLRAMKMKYMEIEQRLSISQSTLKKHLTSLMVKLDCFSQQDLIDFAKSHKWIECKARDNGVEYKIKSYEEIQTIKILKTLD